MTSVPYTPAQVAPSAAVALVVLLRAEVLKGVIRIRAGALPATEQRAEHLVAPGDEARVAGDLVGVAERVHGGAAELAHLADGVRVPPAGERGGAARSAIWVDVVVHAPPAYAGLHGH